MFRNILVLISLCVLCYTAEMQNREDTGVKVAKRKRIVKECEITYYPEKDYSQDVCKAVRIELY